MASTSNIRAFVQWREPTVFSGEDIECVITFKNTASVRRHGDDRVDQETENNTRGGLRARVERQRTTTQSTGVSRPGNHFSTPSSIAGSTPMSSSRLCPPNPSALPPNFSALPPNPSSFPPPASTSQRPSLPRRPSSSYTQGHHRSALSLNVVTSPIAHSRNPSAQSTPLTTTMTSAATGRPRPKHSRSLSIMSMGSDGLSFVHKTPPTPASASASASASAPVSAMTSSRRPPRGHVRSASVQVPSRSFALSSPVVATPPQPPFPLPSPLPRHPSHASQPDAHYSHYRPSPKKAPHTPSIVFPESTNPSPAFAPDFEFPAQPSPNLSHASTPDFEFPPRDTPITIPKTIRAPPQEKLALTATANPVSRVLSDISANGTSRTSSDFYSMDNDSSDTTTSELPANTTTRLLSKPNAARHSSRQIPPNTGEPEILMMGYAQTVGSFVLDAALVNQTPFDQVKRKAVLGGQGGGGVVGVEQRSKRESGFFGSFAWSNVGESLGGLLGSGEMSSIKEMRTVATTKTIPLLSTPQSILFVDLRLAPGQTKSYTYRFRLPRGLPPTYKGRAIKVSYHIKIGIQRSGSLGGHQNVKHIEVPFRVLGSVNNRGESLGHDLMSPYILLNDRAHTANVPTPDNLSVTLANFPAPSPVTTPSNISSTAAAQDFLEYAHCLLANKSSTSEPLLSPSDQIPRRRSSLEDAPPNSVKEAIDIAIQRANLSSDSSDQPSQSTNRFTISRSGQPVAVLSIVRPAYRLGEAVAGVINFIPPSDLPASSKLIPTYSVNISLETVERVDPSLALRSASSIQRATRKVHASLSESVLFARQTFFRLEIPTSATPTFETTGVWLLWRLRVEFVTARQVDVPQQQQATGLGINTGRPEGAGAGAGVGIDGAHDNDDGTTGGNSAFSKKENMDKKKEKSSGDHHALLEEVMRDERGTVLIAKEKLAAETFEVAIPIKVFGVSGLSGAAAAGGGAGTDGGFGNGVAEPLEV